MRGRLTLLLICLASIALLVAPLAALGDEPGDTIETALTTLRSAQSSQAEKIEACAALVCLGPDSRGAEPDVIHVAATSTGPLRDAALKTLRAIYKDKLGALMLLLETGSPADANYAAGILAEMGADAKPAVERFRLMLFSSSANVCLRAFNIIEGLGPVASNADVEESLRQLEGNKAWEIRAAATRALISVTRDKDPIAKAQYEANQAARQKQEQANARATVEGDRAKADDAIDHAQANAHLLAVLADRSSMTALREMLQSDDWNLRLWACQVIGKRGAGAKDALSDLHQLLKDHNLEVRLAAVMSIHAIDPRLDSRTLVATSNLLSRQINLWPHALRTLAQVAEQGGDISEALEAVGDRLVGQRSDLRELAAGVIAKISGPANEYVISSLRDIHARTRAAEDPWVKIEIRIVVVAALLRLDPAGEATADEVRDLLADATKGESFAQIIADSGPASAPLAPRLVEFAKSPHDPAHHKRILRALAGIASPATSQPQTIEVLTEALTEKDDVLPALAAAALGRIGAAAKSSAPAVARLLKSHRDADVAAAARALAGFGPAAEAYLPQIIAILRTRMTTPSRPGDPAADVRAACADVIGKLAASSEEATDLLLLAVARKDWVVREHLAPPMAQAKDKPARLLASLSALADRSPDEMVRINARCALRDLGVQVAAGNQ